MIQQNFETLRKLFGDSVLKIVVFVTTEPERVGSRQDLERNLIEQISLRLPPNTGAPITSHDDSRESAHFIIERVLKNRPVVLRIQQEMIDEVKTIGQTKAGKAVSKELRNLARRGARS